MKVTYLKPNHVCQNPNCKKGANGEPKHYYACDYCGWSENWRSICCSRECFIEKTNIEKEAKKPVKAKRPKRTDMTDEQVEAMMAKPLDEVMEKTMNELAEYKESIDEIGLGPVIDIINEEIDYREQNDE